MYERIPVEVLLAQGDVIDVCPIFALDPSDSEIDLNAPASRWEERVVVLTQACDLAQNKVTRVLVAVVRSAQELVAKGVLKPSVIRDQIRRGLVYGRYFLPTAPEPLALPESIVDLHDLHTVSRAVLERLISDGKRVCRIQTPYREHFAQHFAVTYMRIGLPEPYETEP
ncbi:MAG: hypothetical protein ACRELF_07200 [Gemmataceae bacterium]